MGIAPKLQKRSSSIYVGVLSETVYRDLLFLTFADHPGRLLATLAGLIRLVLLTTLVLTNPGSADCRVRLTVVVPCFRVSWLLGSTCRIDKRSR
jgi:hypothetical protein